MVGSVNALNRLVNPNIKPTAAPTTGPSITAPIITGTCIIVALTGPSGI